MDSEKIGAKTTKHFTYAAGIKTYPCSDSNRITKDYYNFLAGEINRGTIKAAVVAVTNWTSGTESYYKISEP